MFNKLDRPRWMTSSYWRKVVFIYLYKQFIYTILFIYLHGTMRNQIRVVSDLADSNLNYSKYLCCNEMTVCTCRRSSMHLSGEQHAPVGAEACTCRGSSMHLWGNSMHLSGEQHAPVGAAACTCGATACTFRGSSMHLSGKQHAPVGETACSRKRT